MMKLISLIGDDGGGRQMIAFIEKCLLLVDRLRRPNECSIELRLCYKTTTLLLTLLSQSIQCLSHQNKLLQPLCIIESKHN